MAKKKTFFDNISEEFKATNRESLSKEAFEWFELKRRILRPKFQADGAIRKEILKDADRRRQQRFRGRFYMFFYNPKGKRDLSYWDRFPLIYLLKIYKNGSFLGLNFHYVDYKTRALFLSNSIKWATNQPPEENSRLLLRYPTMKKSRKYRAYKAMIKRYDPEHIRSQIIRVPGNEWEIAIHLPVEKFRQVNKRQVWMRSQRLIRKN